MPGILRSDKGGPGGRAGVCLAAPGKGPVGRVSAEAGAPFWISPAPRGELMVRASAAGDVHGPWTSQVTEQESHPLPRFLPSQGRG